MIYRGYDISSEHWSPSPAFDWSFAHLDFDGAPDANDNRYGYGASEQDCKDQIDEMIADEESNV